MKHRIAIATEGRSDRAVLEALCRRAGHVAKAAGAGGKGKLFQEFHKILRVLGVTFQPTHFLVVADLRPDTNCLEETNRWRKAIKERFPGARLCLAIWELEAWLLAHPDAVARAVGADAVRIPNPDKVGDPGPSDVLEEQYARLRTYRPAYDKEQDGKRLAEQLDLEVAAQNSRSLKHFLKTINARQEKLPL
jgi:hypothetical protein